MKFKCLNHEIAIDRNALFYFEDENGRIAVADHSMYDKTNPSTAEDGLLYVRKQEVKIEFDYWLNISKGIDTIVHVDVEREDGSYGGYMIESIYHMPWLKPILIKAGCKIVLSDEVRELIQSLMEE